ncbi:MAG: hypothetical protein ACJ74T_03630 [Pyrinomonadaceae bacterium]
MGESVESCRPGAPCVVMLKDLTNFQWDKMYVFSYGAELSDIQTALGTSFPNFVQFTRRLVFLKDGKIVYREDEPTDIEHAVDGEVNFAGMDTQPSYLMFTPDTAVFNAKKEKHSHGVLYLLTPLK